MKKTINIILLLAVAGLYGTAIYRYIKNSFSDDVAVKQNAVISKSLNMYAARDTFKLTAIKVDPFLHNLNSKIERPALFLKNKKNIVNKKEKMHQVSKVIELWPSIEYYGYIKSGNNKELALIIINGQLHKIHVGEEKVGVRVSAVYKDSVAIKYLNKKKVIRNSKFQ